MAQANTSGVRGADGSTYSTPAGHVHFPKQVYYVDIDGNQQLSTTQAGTVTRDVRTADGADANATVA